jgi:hypothetical protein
MCVRACVCVLSVVVWCALCDCEYTTFICLCLPIPYFSHVNTWFLFCFDGLV